MESEIGMRSHRCDFHWKQLVPVAGWPIGVTVAIALFLHGLHAVDLLPAAWPGQDLDRTILFQKTEMTHSDRDAQILLLGDSSCLMGVDALRMGELFPDSPLVMNFATLSYLGLTDHGKLARAYLDRHPGSRPLVVLLMHPEALRSSMASTYHQSLLDHYLAGRWMEPPATATPFHWLAIPTFQTQLATPVLPPVLPKEFGVRYGFTAGLWRYLQEHRGSGVDPRRFLTEQANASAEYRLSKALEPASKQFRFQLPNSIPLAVGVMPVPESFAWEKHEEIIRPLLKQWGEWLRAEYLLEGLPGVLPSEMFATRTHLNGSGQHHFTRLLADQLKPLLENIESSQP